MQSSPIGTRDTGEGARVLREFLTPRVAHTLIWMCASRWRSASSAGWAVLKPAGVGGWEQAICPREQL